jgi:hypothetical protein
MAMDIDGGGPDLLTIGGYHYETLSTQAGLIDPENNVVSGVIEFHAWKAAVLTDLLSDGMIEAASTLEEELPGIYLKAKIATIGCYLYRAGSRDYVTWVLHLNPFLSDEEQTISRSYLKEAFKLASAVFLGI